MDGEKQAAGCRTPPVPCRSRRATATSGGAQGRKCPDEGAEAGAVQEVKFNPLSLGETGGPQPASSRPTDPPQGATLMMRKSTSNRKTLCLERLEDRCCPSSYSVVDLGTLGGTSSIAEDINVSGQVVGQAYRPGDVGPQGNAFPC